MTEQRILVICESPNKVKTIRQFLPNNYVVKASVGHITTIKDSGKFNLGIDVDKDFKANYKIAEGKESIVKELKTLADASDTVILMSDPDREGEAIAYHLKSELKIPDSKYIRCAVHEITKSAILKSINNPRKIDVNLVNSAITREKADKIIGYRLSGIARKNVGAKSVGRCQSAGLKLIVMREEEILNFIPDTYYDIILNFNKNGIDFKAKYFNPEWKQTDRLTSREICEKILSDCNNTGRYYISDISKKESFESSKPPFITSTFQQEVSKKLNISVKNAMSYAQKLFEGIDINGKHISLITYIRTDDATYAPEFKETLKEFVISKYGNDYYAPVPEPKNNALAQQGHEGIRCIDLHMTPDILKKYISDSKLIQVYDIIYRRTIASSMKPAKFSVTNYNIKNGNHNFLMTSKELIFDGYRKVYKYFDKEDNSDFVSECFYVNELLQNTTIQAFEKQTKPPSRYDESSLVKELDKQGIGRPSTYASILSILLDPKRNYCEVENKKIVPTEHGIKLSHFLDKSFPDIINIKYTAELEKELDLIAQGNLNSITFLRKFYNDIEKSISNIDAEKNDAVLTDKICTKCGNKMILRTGRFGKFYGCSKYPKCKNIEKYEI